MYNQFVLESFVNLVIFLILSTLVFTLPGAYLLGLKNLKFNSWEKLILGTSVGLVIFTLIGYLLLILNLKIILIPVYLIIIFFSVKSISFPKLKLKFLPKWQLILFLILFISGVVLQLLVISPSGITFGGDILFWSSHAHDSSWHIALMNQMEKGWPLMNPALSGERVVNYHFFSDIAPMYFNYLFRLSALDLYFRFFPMIYSILFGGILYLIGKKLTGRFEGGLWSMIFGYFAGSWGYILTLMRGGTIGGEAIFWTSQPQSTIGNPPQIVASILLLVGLYLLKVYFEEKNRVVQALLILTVGSLIVFKVYAGIVFLIAMGAISFWQIIRERRFDLSLTFLGSLLLSFILYFPNSSNTTSFLIFQPWWYVRTMVVSPDKLNLIDWEYKRQTYIADHNYKRILQLELMAFLIFFFGTIGMRFIGLFAVPKSVKGFFKDYFKESFFFILLSSFIIPMLFLQRGVASNSSQFFQYFLILMGILSALTMTWVFQKIRSNPIKILIGIVIVVLAVPTQIGLLQNFYQRPAFTKIDSTELQALDYLRYQTPENSIILTPQYNQYINLKEVTPPVWGWSDTNYIGAFGDRSTYLSDQEQVDIMGYSFQNRKDLEDKLFTTTDPKLFNLLINQTGANYLYLPLKMFPKISLRSTHLQKVFSNPEIEIWKIK